MSYELNLKVNNKRIKQYQHDGKIYVEGREGSAYELELKNNSHQRVLVILSVDGLSVMDGKRADWNNSSGYVVNGHSSIVIPGWRLNDENVAQFTFGGRGDAYAASKGKQAKKNIGTIGCAVFMEKTCDTGWSYITNVGDHPWPTIIGTTYGGAVGNEGYYSAGETAATSSFFVNTPIQAAGSVCSTETKGKEKEAGAPGTLNLGTEFGESTGHAVRTVSFTKEDSPATVMEIIYSDRCGLKEMGVNLKQPAHRRYTEPKPFANTGCEPPSGWHG